jgi:hypothetical protein
MAPRPPLIGSMRILGFQRPPLVAISMSERGSSGQGRVKLVSAFPVRAAAPEKDVKTYQFDLDPPTMTPNSPASCGQVVGLIGESSWQQRMQAAKSTAFLVVPMPC